MSDSLAKFVNDAVEFIGGGALFLATFLFLFDGWGWDPVHALHLSALSTLPTGLLAVVGVTVAYVAGVAAESLSRAMMEWDLHRISVRHPGFWRGDLPRANAGSATSDYPTPKPWPTTTWALARRYWYLGRSDRGSYTADDLHRVLGDREQMRLAADVAGKGKDITSQLKRLRLERMTLLSGVLVTGGFAGRVVVQSAGWPHLRPLLISLVATGVLGMLVHVRFGRYCDAISRGYALIGQRTGDERRVLGDRQPDAAQDVDR